MKVVTLDLKQASCDTSQAGALKRIVPASKWPAPRKPPWVSSPPLLQFIRQFGDQ